MPAAAGDTAQTILHASAVGLEGRGVLILGASGAGKSSLALELMARGAALVADDRVWLTRRGTAVILTPPAAIAGRIEARGVGLLGAAWRPAELAVAVDLDRPEPERLPPRRTITLMDMQFGLILGAGNVTLAAQLIQLLKGGRIA